MPLLKIGSRCDTMASTNEQRNRSLRRLLTAAEAAVRLGITPKTLWEWVNRGIIPQVKLPGAKPKYDIHDIDRIIEAHKTLSPAAQAAADLLHNSK